MSNKIITILVVLVLVGGGFLVFKNKGIAPTDEDMSADTESIEAGDMDMSGDMIDDNPMSPAPTPTPASNPTPSASTGTVKKFTVESGSFYFSPKTLTVNKGDTVEITVKNLNGVHDLKIDEFNAGTTVMSGSASQTITFVADKTGTFEYYCSVGSHRSMGMWGTLTVR